MLTVFLIAALANTTVGLTPLAPTEPSVICPAPERDALTRKERDNAAAGDVKPMPGISRASQLALIDFRIGIAEADPVRLRTALKTLPVKYWDGSTSYYADLGALVIAAVENDAAALPPIIARLRKLSTRSTEAIDPGMQFGRNELLISALVTLAKTGPRSASELLLQGARARLGFLQKFAAKEGDENLRRAAATAGVEVARAAADADPSVQNIENYIALLRNLPVDANDAKAMATQQLNIALALASSLDSAPDAAERAGEALRIFGDYERDQELAAAKALGPHTKRAFENLAGQWPIEGVWAVTPCLAEAKIKEARALIEDARISKLKPLNLTALAAPLVSLRAAERAYEAQPAFTRSARHALMQAKGWRRIGSATSDRALRARAGAERDAALKRGFAIVAQCLCTWEKEDLIAEQSRDWGRD